MCKKFPPTSTSAKPIWRRPAEQKKRQKAEGKKTEDRRQKAEGRRQKAEGRRQKAEDRRQKAEGRRLLLFSAFCFAYCLIYLRANLQGQEKMPLKKTQSLLSLFLCLMISAAFPLRLNAQRTQKPPLHGRHWMAITGKPLAATAGAMIFQKGGNAVDAACAMIAATSTMWDTLSWGGETQALIYNPNTGKVIGINALGVAPTGATPEFFHKKGMNYPPEFGPLAAVTPGTPGGLMIMLAEYGTMSLAEVLAPAIEMADGYPMEAELSNTIEHYKDKIAQWPYSKL